MANLPIPDEQTYVQFDVVAASAGPFPFNFSVFSKADLRVTLNGYELEQTDFTFLGIVATGGYDGGSITLNTAATGELTIWREVVPARATDFAPANLIPVTAVDQALDRLTAYAQDARRDLERSLSVPVGETLNLLPDADSRASKVLSFDAFGQPTPVDAVSAGAAAAVDLSNVPTTIFYSPGNYTVGVDTVLTDVYLLPGAIFNIATGVTLTINGFFWANRKQCFNCVGTGRVIFGEGAVLEGYPEWFGAVVGGADCILAIELLRDSLVPRLRFAYGSYNVSRTVKANRGYQSWKGAGPLFAGSSSATRFVVTGSSAHTMQLGADAFPGSINAMPAEIHVSDISFGRTAAPTPVAGLGNGPAGLDMKFCRQSSVTRCRAEENKVGFRIGGVAGSEVRDCYSNRSLAGSAAPNDNYVAFYLDGTVNIGAAGGNASLCVYGCYGMLSRSPGPAGESYGLYADGSFVDTVVDTFNIVEVDYGVYLNGNASQSGSADFHLKTPILDGFHKYGIVIFSPSEYTAINISGHYCAPANVATAIAGVLITGSKGSISIMGGQVVGWPYPAAIGMFVTNSRGVFSSGNKYIGSSRPLVCDTVTLSTFQDIAVNPAEVNTTGAFYFNATTKCSIKPIVSGGAAKFSTGVEFAGATCHFNTVDPTGIDPAALTGGLAANKLRYNATQITALGVFGVDNQAVGVIA